MAQLRAADRIKQQMKTVECGIKAYDIHELLCHFVARRAGLYESAGLDVRLVDTSFIPDDELPETNFFQVACGAALMSRKARFRVLLAAVVRPMFWLYASAETESVTQLAGKRIATYPALAPPYWFTRIALRNHGLDAAVDVELQPTRDDALRLGLLREGAVDAAVLSSALSPVMIRRQGFRLLAMLGDEIRFVSAGIAATVQNVQQTPDLFITLADIYRQSLALIHGQPELVQAILLELMAVPDEVAAKTCELILPCYTRDGYVAPASLQTGLNALSKEQGTDSIINVDEFYDLRR